MRARRAFTLIEMMVASSIAIVLVLAAAQVAVAMARNIKRVEHQADMGQRAAVVQAFLENSITPAAYNWSVTQTVGSALNGSLGAGACVASTGMCTGTGEIAPPLRICDGATVTASTCNAPTTTTSDALWTFLPRDTLIDAMQIIDRNGTALTSACTATNVPSPVTFDVRGTNAVDDLQFQLDIARMPAGGAPAFCVSNRTDVFTGATIGAGPCSGERLFRDSKNSSGNRVIGLRIGLLLRSATQVLEANISTTGLFDRTGTTFTDKRLRRSLIYYVGLPNVATL